jgi:hypothetical protein
MNTNIKKELRDYFGFTNIKQTYSIFGVNDSNKAYKLLQKEYDNVNKNLIKAESKKKVQNWVESVAKVVTIKKELKNKLKKEKVLKEKVLKPKKEKNYIQEVIVNFIGKYKHEANFRPINITKNITGPSSQLNKLAKEMYEDIMYKIQQKSPMIIKKNSGNYKTATPIEINSSNGLENIKMKNAGSFDLSNENKQEWNTNTGKCVFDYLIHLYGNVKGFKKIMNYEYLNKEFNYDNEDDALVNGVSINQIHKFCIKYNLSYYALDCYEKTIMFYIPPKKTHNVTSLIFRIINEHMYPIENFTKRKSIVSKNRGECNIKSIDIEKSIIERTNYDIYEVVSPDDECDKNNFAIEFIEKLNKIPYPICSKNIYVEDGNIQRLIIDKKLILTEPINESIKNFYENGTNKYQGECIQNIVYMLWEETYGKPIYESSLMSSYSPDVKELFQQKNIKYRTHFGSTREINENMEDLFLNEGAVSCDIEKCYSSLLLNPMDDFIKLDTYNELEFFLDDDYYYNNDELPLGLYVVETDDMTILHKSNVYSNKILDYAKIYGVSFNIKYKIVPCDKIYKNYFHDILIKIKERTNDPNLIKLVMNSITGCLGKTYSKKLKVGLTTNINEIFENEIMGNNIKVLNKKNEVKEILTRTIDHKKNDFYFKKLTVKSNDFFIFGEIEKTKMVSNALPIYIQILDWSNIKLHQMITEMGGECIYRKTDCAVCIGGNQVYEFKKDINSITKTWGSFRNEDCSSDNVIERNYKIAMKLDRGIDIPIKNDVWKVHSNLKSSNQWNEILDCAILNNGLFIDGRAGTGKSYIIHKGIESKILNADKKYRLAFTNKAARNIDGTTIHKILKINKNNKSNGKCISMTYKGKCIICIDEIGMISLNLWKKLLLLKETNRELIFILLGDQRQCKPIEDLNIDYFNSIILKSLVNFNKCELTERQRYDENLWNFLENYYENGITGKLKHSKLQRRDMKTSKMICYYNKTRDGINDLCMEYLKPENCLYLPYERKKDEDGNDDITDKAKSAYIYIDLPIMCIKNNKEFDIINTDEFKVKNLNDEEIILTNLYTNNELIIKHTDFHKNFVVNYISTTHKLQGSTITEKLYIFDWYCRYGEGITGLQADKHVGYTALSRVKSLDQIYIVC